MRLQFPLGRPDARQIPIGKVGDTAYFPSLSAFRTPAAGARGWHRGCRGPKTAGIFDGRPFAAYVARAYGDGGPQPPSNIKPSNIKPRQIQYRPIMLRAAHSYSDRGQSLANGGRKRTPPTRLCAERCCLSGDESHPTPEEDYADPQGK